MSLPIISILSMLTHFDPFIVTLCGRFRAIIFWLILSKGRVPKKKKRISYGLLPNPPSDPLPPPGMVFLRIKKFTPIFFWKLNLWLPKRILHLVPLKNLFFSTVIMVYFFHQLTIQRGGGTIKEVIKCHFQSCLNSCRYAQNSPDQV